MTTVDRPRERIEFSPSDTSVTTLLDLVAAVAKISKSDAEAVVRVTELINSRRVTLVGAFREQDVRIGL